MGRKSAKENKNIYQILREERNLTREKASELLDTISSEKIEKIVEDLVMHLETMDEDEFEKKYNSLPVIYQMEVDDAILEFADNAIGDISWRSDW